METVENNIKHEEQYYTWRLIGAMRRSKLGIEFSFTFNIRLSLRAFRRDKRVASCVFVLPD